MSKAAGPDLTKYMDKSLAIKLNGNRSVNGVLRGFDQFMNIVLEECVETTPNAPTKQQNVGTVVIRGNSILMIEALEKI